MIIDAIRNEIITYTSVTGYVSRYQSLPAVFSKNAPDAALTPYIVIRVDMSSDSTNIIDVANVYIDLYEDNSSGANQESVALSLLNNEGEVNSI